MRLPKDFNVRLTNEVMKKVQSKLDDMSKNLGDLSKAVESNANEIKEAKKEPETPKPEIPELPPMEIMAAVASSQGTPTSQKSEKQDKPTKKAKDDDDFDIDLGNDYEEIIDQLKKQIADLQS